MKLHAHKLALAAALVSAAGMLLLSLLNGVGLYQSAASQMMGWHMYYRPNATGTLFGMIEAAVITYIYVFPIAWVYNRLLESKK
jgi:hypothetical protein